VQGQQFEDVTIRPDAQAEYIDSTVTAIATAISECLALWSIAQPGLDEKKAGLVISEALQARALQRHNETIRQCATFVMGRITRKELNRFL
jgi:hypothetical protein